MSTQVSMTFTFASTEAAAAFLSGKSQAVPVSAAATVHTERTAEAAGAGAQETKALDFDKDVVPALKALNTKDKKAFGELMKKHGFSKVTDVQAKPATWAEVVAACA